MPHQGRVGNRFVVLVTALAVVVGLSIAFGLSSSTGASPLSKANPARSGPASPGLASQLSSAEPKALDKAVASEDAGALRAPAQGAPTKGTWFIGKVGTYLVGRGIPPGTYESAGASGGSVCMWSRVKGLAGTKDDILGTGSSSKRVVVTILKTDGFFETRNCANWHKIS